MGNLRNAITRLDVPYAVVQDNDRQTWGAYNNRFWPTIYLIDKQGNIRYKHIGEGAYDRTERAIQALLSETYTPPTEDSSKVIWSLTATDPLNVRSGPGTDFDKIGIILPNEAYYVLEAVTNGWYKILFDGADAYVFGDYVQVKQ